MAKAGRPRTDEGPPRYPNRLAAVRDRREMTQERLAELFGSATSTISKLELGKRRLKVDQLLKLASILRVDIRAILEPDPANTIDVLGELGPSGIIEPFRSDGDHQVECPAGLDPSRTAAAIVRGNGLFPHDSGMMIFFDKIDLGQDRTAAVGHLCIIRQRDAGPLIVGQLRQTDSGRYSVWTSRGPIVEDVAIKSAAPIRAALRPELVWRLGGWAYPSEANEPTNRYEAAEQPSPFQHARDRMN